MRPRSNRHRREGSRLPAEIPGDIGRLIAGPGTVWRGRGVRPCGAWLQLLPLPPRPKTGRAHPTSRYARRAARASFDPVAVMFHSLKILSDGATRGCSTRGGPSGLQPAMPMGFVRRGAQACKQWPDPASIPEASQLSRDAARRFCKSLGRMRFYRMPIGRTRDRGVVRRCSGAQVRLERKSGYIRLATPAGLEPAT